ncbi:MAG: hypothetical protein LBS91_00415 [Clostridiales Family XIII bacterium]|jgi:hypothetical protein|nr:hypothetical protein [Clostridiales Family XIII bacterium]
MKAFSRIMIPVFAVSVYMYCIFLFFAFSSKGQAVGYNYFVVLGCAAIAAFVNYRLAKREHSVLAVGIINIIMAIAAEFLGFAAADAIEGVFLLAALGLAFLVPVLSGLWLSRSPAGANTILVFCELSLAGTAMFFGIQLGEFTVPAAANVLCIVALVLNLAFLSALRALGPLQKAETAKRGIERGALLACGMFAIVAAAVICVMFLLPPLRAGLFASARATKGFLAFAGAKITEFFEFLFSLFPADSAGGIGLPPGPEPGGLPAEAEMASEIPVSLSSVALAIAAACAIVAVAAILCKMRKQKLACAKAPTAFCEEETEERLSLLAALRGLAGRLALYWAFAHRRMQARGTYEEVFIRFARKAGRRGLGRMASETPAEYFARVLAGLPCAAEGNAAGVDIRKGRQLFELIAIRIDKRLYAPGQPAFERMNPDDVKAVMRIACCCSRVAVHALTVIARERSDRGNP